MKVVMMKGLPGSGKSTKAQQYVDKGFVRLNRDSMRLMFARSKYNKDVEKHCKFIRDEMLKRCIELNQSVVIDDTNLRDADEAHFRQIVSNYNPVFSVSFEVDFIDMPVEQCIKNDLKREHSVGKDVIMRMYNEHLRPEPLDIVYNFNLKDCVICDIDGTIAQMVNRGPYDFDKVSNDCPVDCVIDTVMRYAESTDARLIFMSGRDDSCRHDTYDWIVNYMTTGPFELYMRKTEDNRKDSIVKREMFEEHVLGKYNPIAVFDDRDQVVDMWRNELGLQVYQVADGNF